MHCRLGGSVIKRLRLLSSVLSFAFSCIAPPGEGSCHVVSQPCGATEVSELEGGYSEAVDSRRGGSMVELSALRAS